jgi:hypothetical protein
VTSVDVWVIGGGLVLGYLVVSALMGRKTPTSAPAPSTTPEDTDGLALKGVGQAIPAHWSSVLGIPRDASVDQIRVAYESMTELYDPQKVADLGQELGAVARAKSEEIRVAYREALAEHRLIP